MRPVFDWNIGKRALQVGKQTLIMGVVNVTPDSFSDGGKYLDCDAAVNFALQLLADGAAIVDIGGESTRPGAAVLPPAEKAPEKSRQAKPGSAAKPVVSEKEELERVIPVIRALKQKRPDSIVSVDTYKAAVAREAVKSGAEIVNDVSGFRWDAQMKKAVAELKCGAVLVHMRGRPEEWRKMPASPDIVVEVKRELREWADAATMAGIKRDHLVLDPGFGFGKSFEQNYPLLKRFEELHQLHYPLLVGISKKSFIGRALACSGKDAPVEDRLHGSLAAEVIAVIRGAHIIRTHEVKACRDALRIADAVM